MKRLTCKNTLIFIHGFRKTSNDWNITDKGKDISIEKTLKKSFNTILIDINDNDYLSSIESKCEEIYKITEEFFGSHITIITHSYGSFFGIMMVKKWPKQFTKLMMIEPTLKNESYKKYISDQIILSDENDPAIKFLTYKSVNFDKFPDHNNIPNNIIVRIHSNISSCDELLESIKLKELYQITNKNTKSRFNVHVDASHMIHYKLPHIMIDAIKELALI